MQLQTELLEQNMVKYIGFFKTVMLLLNVVEMSNSVGLIRLLLLVCAVWYKTYLPQSFE